MRGKGAHVPAAFRRSRDHPRMCGEKVIISSIVAVIQGSPPHVRGKGLHILAHGLDVGITPACAGKRQGQVVPGFAFEDHPRMCGEKSATYSPFSHKIGSPPHVRGKDAVKRHSARGFGITPACAGKSTSALLFLSCSWDHPRMCGEKYLRIAVFVLLLGSPPHVRGKASFFGCSRPGDGITPAYAGKRFPTAALFRSSRDHPRVCGEKGWDYDAFLYQLGSPPRMRGKAGNQTRQADPLRITPAYAGKRLKRSRSTVPPVAIVPLFPSVCNKPVVSDGSPAGRDAPLFLPAENAVPASPAYNLRSL